MKTFQIMTLLAALAVASSCSPKSVQTSAETPPAYVLVIHGGAGAMKRASMTPEMEAAYHSSLDAALNLGDSLLRGGASALDAVEAVVRLLEDDSLFNAGRGAVLTAEGAAELDASIMDGASGMAGAVAGVRTVKHPISAARQVMEKTEHVMLTGAGADAFAASAGLDLVPNAYFITRPRKTQLENQKKGKAQDGASNQVEKHGTVGAVALDKAGNLAAATSTGGMTNKRFGRVGDSPIIGAGAYAANDACAVSCTGHGEFFIRLAIAYDVAARMRYGGQSLAEAAHQVIHQSLAQAGGTGGLIALDRAGHIAMPFNTDGMFRGYVTANGERSVAIYAE